MLPPDPADELVTGPGENWLPGGHHLAKIKTWASFLEKLGIPRYKADAIAFELWKLGQKIDST